jgi:hypothetical protein
MTKFTKFSWNQYGELVYRNTGRAAPAAYTVKGSSVYGKDGRRIGFIGKGTAAQQAKIRKAATAGGRSAAAVKGRFSFNNIRKARERALKTTGELKLVTPTPTKAEIKNFGRSVRNMAALSIKENPALYEKIKNMKDSELMTLFRENKMIFDVYFDYGGVTVNNDGSVSGDANTAKNAQALITAYEERFGPIGVQSRL